MPTHAYTHTTLNMLLCQFYYKHWRGRGGSVRLMIQQQDYERCSSSRYHSIKCAAESKVLDRVGKHLIRRQ